MCMWVCEFVLYDKEEQKIQKKEKEVKKIKHPKPKMSLKKANNQEIDQY